MNASLSDATRPAPRSLMMIVAVAALAFTFSSASNATQIDVGPFESDGHSLLNIDGHDVSIYNRAIKIDLSRSGSGYLSAFTLRLQTVVFHTEPVVLNGLSGEGSGFAIVSGGSGMSFANAGSSFENVLVSSVTFILSPYSTNGITGLDVTFGIGEATTQANSTPSNPVPEPTAALLFAVGLTAASSQVRREQR